MDPVNDGHWERIRASREPMRTAPGETIQATACGISLLGVWGNYAKPATFAHERRDETEERSGSDWDELERQPHCDHGARSGSGLRIRGYPAEMVRGHRSGRPRDRAHFAGRRQ